MSKEVNKLIFLFFSFSIIFFISGHSSNKTVDSCKYFTYSSIKQKDALRYKINKVCALRNYNHRVDRFSRFIYMDIEIFGDSLRIDLDDFEAEVVEENGKEVESWPFDIIFLDKYGRKAKSTSSNNNLNYLHIGVVVPATEKSKKVRLHYWDSSIGNKLLVIGNYQCEIR
jgi:hypothetical protein